MLSYLWDSMLIVLVGGIGWTVASAALTFVIFAIFALFVVIFGKFIE